jgi:riboflavin synthase
MFTGIIEATGVVVSVSDQGSNKTFLISAPIAPSLRIDQSLSHDGVCLTVESISGESYRVTAIAETLSKTCISQWRTGSRINLERCLQVNGRLDGHMVQGHIDTTARCILKENQAGSWLFRFEFPVSFRNLIIEKGSVALNGISLTCFDVSDSAFSVAIIPFTFEHTNIGELVPGSPVNIEFDLIGKYIARLYHSEREF